MHAKEEQHASWFLPTFSLLATLAVASLSCACSPGDTVTTYLLDLKSLRAPHRLALPLLPDNFLLFSRRELHDID